MSYPTDPGVARGPAPAEHPGRALGIVSVVILGVLVFLPGIAIQILIATVDPLIGWYVVMLFPVALAVSVLTLALSLVGLVTAVRRQAPFGWPLTGMLLSIGVLLFCISIFTG